MFIFESVGNVKYICGIFEDKEDVKTYLGEVPSELRKNQRVHEVELQYPFYIIERDGFEFVNQEGLIARLDQMKVSHHDNEVYSNIYLIETDYRPKKAGIDDMGMIRHVHVTPDFVRWYTKEGIEYLRRTRML